MGFLVLFLCLLALTFKRVRMVAAGIAICAIAIMIPGLFPDPSVAWLLVFAIAVFSYLVYFAVWLIARNQKKRLETEAQIQANVQEVFARQQTEKTFGKFRLRN